MADDKKILVLGVGNLLYSDESIGLRVVEQLEERYTFSDNVTLMDGGTLGTRLMGPIMESDLLLVVDAVLGNGKPGDLYRLTGEDLRKSVSFKNSMHQTDLEDTLIYCGLVGNRPDAVVIGVEPEDYTSMSTELTPALAGRMDEFVAAVLKEVEAAGGECVPKP